LDEEPERFVGDAVLGKIEKQTGGFGRHAFAALRIIGEQFPEVKSRDFRVMSGEGAPCRASGG
jgi:hypothetical protein